MKKLLYLIFIIQIAQASSQAPQTNSPKSPSKSSSNVSKEIEEQISSEGYATILAIKNGARRVTLFYPKKNNGLLSVTLEQTITSDGKTNDIKAIHDVARGNGWEQKPFQLSPAFKTKFETLKDSMFKLLKENDVPVGCFNISNDTVSGIEKRYIKRDPYSPID